MDDLKYHKRKLYIKGQGDLYGGSADINKYTPGECDACGQYDVELVKCGDYNVCRHDECQAVRNEVDRRKGRWIKKSFDTTIKINTNTEEAFKDYHKAFSSLRVKGKIDW